MPSKKRQVTIIIQDSWVDDELYRYALAHGTTLAKASYALLREALQRVSGAVDSRRGH